MEYTTLGQTGLRVSRLAIGTGTHGWGYKSDQTALGLDGLTNLLCEAYEQGVNFWDTADQYGSHAHVARALERVPRDRVVIATKTNSQSGARVADDVARFCRELGTDVLDIVLLHGVSSGDWPRRYADAMDALSRAKEAGMVRAVGISCHGLEALRVAATTSWLDVVLARINYGGVNMDGSVAEVVPALRALYDAGKGIYAMKVLGCGRLTHDPRAAIRYVFELGTVHSASIGMISSAQLAENVRLTNGIAPLFPPSSNT
ncbi:MAG TPA: aldo/keto reductase [Chloroflexi bacterium]|jgi:aryl-alcohol dehydrogenase-like predicted oxidoreductase|nr:aldo/keto reductase [Chloroflexota bacterium]